MSKAIEVSPFHKDVFRGKVVAVTGGSSGIGLEIAKQYGLHGASVAICGRRKQPIDDAVANFASLGIRSFGATCDVRKNDQALSFINSVVQEFGRLDILVNSAAGNFLCPAEDLSVNGFKTVMEIDAVGVFNMSKAAFNALKGHGTIINISATLHYGATWFQVHASAAKAAIDSITRTLGMEWGSEGIRTVGVAPGPVAGTAGMTKLAPGMSDAVNKLIPLGRMATKWEIAMSCLFLASHGAGYITGETLVVDGGSWLNTSLTPPIPKEMVRQASRGIEAKSRKTGLTKSKL
jgi:peroxisomal 2,4-dienoyl-CoA reductase